MRKSLQFALAAGSMSIFASAAMAKDATEEPVPPFQVQPQIARSTRHTGATLGNLARASFPAHMGRASGCAVHMGGAGAPDRASKP